MKLYELLYTIPGNIVEEQAVETATQLTREVQDAGGVITREDRWGKRRLAYPILHLRQGYQGAVEFRIEPKSLLPLRAKIALMEGLARREIFSKYVKTAEALARESAARERILIDDRKRVQELRPSTITAPIPTGQTLPDAPKVDVKQLEEKLEKMLSDDAEQLDDTKS